MAYTRKNNREPSSRGDSRNNNWNERSNRSSSNQRPRFDAYKPRGEKQSYGGKPSRKPYDSRGNGSKPRFEKTPMRDSTTRVEPGFNQARFDNIYTLAKKRNVRYFTKSLYPFRGFEEQTIKREGAVFREVDPERSKLFAGVAKGLSQCGIREGSQVLYLGASHGYTPSFISDVIGKNGRMLCLDVAPRVVRDLVFVCQKRENMAPLLADCRQYQTYKEFIPKEGIDVIFQDIAQRDQVSIFLNNCHAYLKKGGFGLLALKARSVDVSKKPEHIFKETQAQLEEEQDFTIVDKRELAPFEKDHMLFVIKRKA